MTPAELRRVLDPGSGLPNSWSAIVRLTLPYRRPGVSPFS